MCLITTSYPCPEPDVGDLLHRLNNTRKVVPCRKVKADGGRPLSCAGEIQVQHHCLGQLESCSWCSLTAKSTYAEMTGGAPQKRKAGRDAVDEEGMKGGDERMAKKAKTGEMREAHESGVVDTVTEAVETDNDVLAETVGAMDQDSLVDIAKEAFDPQEVGEAPALEGNSAPELWNAGIVKSTATECIEAAVDRPKEMLEAAEVIQEQGQTEDAPTTQGPPVCTSNTAVEDITRVKEGVETVNIVQEEQKNRSPTIEPAEKVNRTCRSNSKVRVVPTRLLTSKVPSAEHSAMSDFEQVQLLIIKINQKRIKAEKDREEILKRNSNLVGQISQHQHEIAGLQTRTSQQNTQHQIEIEKQKTIAKDADAEKSALELEKQDLEAKTGRLMQRNDELVKAASLVSEGTKIAKEPKSRRNQNREGTKIAKATIGGKQNQVVELEGQIAIMKQVEDNRKGQLEEARGQNEVLQRQMMGFRTKTVGLEAEIARLKQGMAVAEEENLQLRAAVVQRVLATPTSQGPASTSDSLPKSEQDCKQEE